MLHHEACERNRKVITKTLFANFEREGLAVVSVLRAVNPVVIIADAGKGVS